MPQVLGKEYRVFDGDIYKNLMPQLIQAGLVPMTVADVMRARLEAVNSNDLTKKEFWLDRYFATADGVAYHDGKVKIVHDTQALKDIKPDTQLSRGALPLTPEQYRALEGQEFSRRDLEKAGLSERLSESKAKSHPVWQALARDNHLLEEYVDAIFAEVKQRYNDNDAMGVYLGSEQESPTMRAWFVGDLSLRSYADGGDLDYDARLVGVRSESAEGAAQNKILDEKVVNALKEGQAFVFKGQLYVPVSKDARVRLE